MRTRQYLLVATTLAALLAGCGRENGDSGEYSKVSYKNHQKISITRPGLPKDYPYATGTPATFVVSYPGNGYFLYVDGTKLDLGNSRRVSELEAQGLLVGRINMQESGYKTGTNQLGRDAVSITSLYPGNLGVIAQGYDGSRDSTTLAYQGECFFTQPPLASREDTLKFVASSAAKATGKRITNTVKDVGDWLKGKFGEAKTEIDKWKSEKGKGKGGKKPGSSDDTY